MEMSSNESQSMTIFTFGTQTRPNQIINEQIDNTDPNSTEIEVSENILSIIFKGGKLGAAYYNCGDRMLFVYEEIPDYDPDYPTAVSILREVQPTYLITFGNVANNFVKLLIDLLNGTSDNTISTDTVRSIPKNMELLPLKDYSYEVCRIIVSDLKLMSNRDYISATKNEVHINSRVNFDDRLSIHALGTLAKFLKKKIGATDDLQFLDVNQVSRRNHVLIDNGTFRALQVFSPQGHEANFKRGIQSSTREGFSIFKMFSASCKSRIGIIRMKDLLLNPVNDFDTLNNRLDFLDFILDPKQRELVEELQDNMKFLPSDLNMILTRIENMRASSRDWYHLYKTIYHMIVINDKCANYKEQSSILMDLSDAITNELIELGNAIENALDFKASEKQGRPVIRFGLDEALDEKKLRQKDISKNVTAAARLAADNLPNFLEECAVVYLPEMGHLISIKEWEEDCNPEALEYLGFKFVFSLRGKFHFKNPLCVELDRRLGDINGEIIDHENRILRRLSGFICKYNKNIRGPLKIISLLDCLISIGKVSSLNSFVRPKLNDQNLFEIKGGRHPLMEQIITQYQANDFLSGKQHSRLKIITGPNGSGKTIFIKQVALIIYLAHIGAYIPAQTGNIGLTKSIYSRLQTTESASIRLSSFMIDITQITKALNTASSNSLILMDEFGRGTTEEDGISILVGVLKHYLNLGQDCPHILLSTHFQQIISFLPKSPLIEYQKMEHTKQDNEIFFLYKISEGLSDSYAIDVAERTGLDKDLISRAREILDCLKNNRPIDTLPQFKAKLQSSSNLSRLNIPKPDLVCEN